VITGSEARDVLAAWQAPRPERDRGSHALNLTTPRPDCMKSALDRMGAVNTSPWVGRSNRSQPRFGLVKEGIDLLHVVAMPGGRELVAVGRRPRQRGWPDAVERVANNVEEGIELRFVIAVPPTAG
jgi:hypothetical protein